jgi:hypothetical protein
MARSSSDDRSCLRHRAMTTLSRRTSPANFRVTGCERSQFVSRTKVLLVPGCASQPKRTIDPALESSPGLTCQSVTAAPSQQERFGDGDVRDEVVRAAARRSPTASALCQLRVSHRRDCLADFIRTTPDPFRLSDDVRDETSKTAGCGRRAPDSTLAAV